MSRLIQKYKRTWREGYCASSGVYATCPYFPISISWLGWQFGLDAGLQKIRGWL